MIQECARLQLRSLLVLLFAEMLARPLRGERVGALVEGGSVKIWRCFVSSSFVI